MRKSKFTESQIVATLKQVEGGRQVKDVCRRKLPRQAGTSKVELSMCLLRYSTGVIPPSESWDLASL